MCHFLFAVLRESGILMATFALAKKTIGRIRTGAAANSPKACAAFYLCRRDVREAVPYEGDRRFCRARG